MHQLLFLLSDPHRAYGYRWVGRDQKQRRVSVRIRNVIVCIIYILSAKKKWKKNNALFGCKRGAQECLISPYLPHCNVAGWCSCALVAIILATFGVQVAEISKHDSAAHMHPNLFLLIPVQVNKLLALANSLGFSPILAGWCVYMVSSGFGSIVDAAPIGTISCLFRYLFSCRNYNFLLWIWQLRVSSAMSAWCYAHVSR